MMTADFTRTDLTHTDLRGVDLRATIGLTREQIDLAIIDENTRLPDYLDELQEEPANRVREEPVFHRETTTR